MPFLFVRNLFFLFHRQLEPPTFERTQTRPRKNGHDVPKKKKECLRPRLFSCRIPQSSENRAFIANTQTDHAKCERCIYTRNFETGRWPFFVTSPNVLDGVCMAISNSSEAMRWQIWARCFRNKMQSLFYENQTRKSGLCTTTTKKCRAQYGGVNQRLSGVSSQSLTV